MGNLNGFECTQCGKRYYSYHEGIPWWNCRTCGAEKMKIALVYQDLPREETEAWISAQKTSLPEEPESVEKAKPYGPEEDQYKSVPKLIL